jgi:hypothetical protein
MSLCALRSIDELFELFLPRKAHEYCVYGSVLTVYSGAIKRLTCNIPTKVRSIHAASQAKMAEKAHGYCAMSGAKLYLRESQSPVTIGFGRVLRCTSKIKNSCQLTFNNSTLAMAPSQTG